MLSVLLACDDPYETADVFTAKLGWTLVFATPPESGDPLAAVVLGDAQVLLGVADERFLKAEARDHRGAGVEIYVNLPADLDIEAVHRRHADAGVVTDPLAVRPWGERAFHAEVAGYRFLIAQDAAEEAAEDSATAAR
jgi:hypothetical protein